MLALIYFDIGTCSYMFEQEKKKDDNFQNFIYKVKYMEDCEAITSSTYNFTYSYRLFKKRFVEN